MQFQEYQSKPIIRKAFELKHDHIWYHVVGKEATYKVYDVNKPEVQIQFKAHEYPKVGDWIVQLTKEDTYHVSDAVFRERNIV